MKQRFGLKSVSVATLIGSIVPIVAAFWQQSYWQGLLLSIGSAFLSVSIALFTVNIFLNSSEKKAAIKPLLRIVAKDFQKINNDLVNNAAARKIGSVDFKNLIKIYISEDGNPLSFNEEQIDKMYSIIIDNKNELIEVYKSLSEKLKYITNILGWSYDQELLVHLIGINASALAFLGCSFDNTINDKRAAVENYIDVFIHIMASTHIVEKRFGIEVAHMPIGS